LLLLTSPLLAEVDQAAQAAGLGAPTQEFHVGNPPARRGRIASFMKKLEIEWVFVLVVLEWALLGTCVTILFTVSFPGNLIFGGLPLAPGVIVLAIIRLLIRRSRGTFALPGAAPMG
jgi:hypothetical protein